MRNPAVEKHRFAARLVLMRLALLVVCNCPFISGCRSVPCSKNCASVDKNLSERIGHTIPCDTCSHDVTFPPGASLDDGLTEDEAVAIALWNNAAFQELLVDLGLARADLEAAGLLPNPELVYYWPMSDKPFKYLFDFPIESLWLRPIRVRSAAAEADRTASRLAQAGLDLMRDVRQSYADVVLAQDRVRIATQSVELRGRIAELAEKRLKAGDISPQEAATAKIDMRQAEQEAARVQFEVPILKERLRNLMGISSIRVAFTLDAEPASVAKKFDVESLTSEALSSRPDAAAASEAVEAAKARLNFAKVGWVRFLGIADATSGRHSHVLGPAVRMTLPLFHHNQGAIDRAAGELERASRNQTTVSNQIILDVQRAYLQYSQASTEIELLQTKVRPEVEGAVRRAQGAYQEGNVPIFIVLENTRQLLDNSLREAQLQSDLRRFWAELERSVGRRLILDAETAHASMSAANKCIETTEVSTSQVEFVIEGQSANVPDRKERAN